MLLGGGGAGGRGFLGGRARVGFCGRGSCRPRSGGGDRRGRGGCPGGDVCTLGLGDRGLGCCGRFVRDGGGRRDRGRRGGRRGRDGMCGAGWSRGRGGSVAFLRTRGSHPGANELERVPIRLRSGSVVKSQRGGPPLRLRSGSE